MKPLKLAPTISTPELEDTSSNSNFAKKVRMRDKANIIEGYTLVTEFDSPKLYNFFSEINVDNGRLWDVVKALVSQFPDDVAFIYHHIDDEPVYGKYLDKYELINTLEKYKLELTQDGFLKFGIISNTEDFLEEVFVEKAKYLQYWGVNKEKFIETMNKNDLYYVKNLDFIDGYPLETRVLSYFQPNAIETIQLLKEFDELFR